VRVSLRGNIGGVIEDAARWDDRYASRVTGEPSAPEGLAGIALADRGLCLDVACGLGEQSLWAARRGFEVVALDVSPVAVDAVRRSAAAHGLADRVDARIVDLDGGIPRDLTGICSLVICRRFRDRRLYPQLVEALMPGGVLVVTVLSQVGAVEPGAAFRAEPGELEDAFSALDVVIERATEAGGEATLVARRNPA
jgi:SAM-dependent methyltransferase